MDSVLSPKFYAGADILPAVDTVPGGPDDLRHIGPYAVKAGTAERPPVSGSRNRYFAGFGLFPDTVDNIRCPIVIAQTTPAWI